MTGAVLGLSMVPLTATGSAAATTDLIFSEYVEGSGFNKAIEIYNGTGAPVDLSAYGIRLYSNGAVTPSQAMTLSGTLADGDVFVLAHASAAPEVLAVADVTNSAVANWNGDDAVALAKNATDIDVIGRIGERPSSGQWGTGDASTADNTIRRKTTVTTGDADGSDAFDPAVEWDGYPINTLSGLGAHDGGGAVDEAPTVVSTVPADGATNISVTQSQSVTFSEDVLTAADAFSLVCDGAVVDVAVTGSGAARTIDPAGSLPSGATCTLTVHAAGVTDRDGEPNQLAADHVVSFGTAPRPAACDTSATPAYDIQGSGATSPLSGTVTTAGVVVGDYEGPAPALRGFYLQDATGDGDSATSDGVFVFNGNDTEVSLGDVVRVTGSVSEFQGQTQVSARPDGVVVCGTGAVEPTEVQLPFASEADRERLEGMLVELPQTLSVTELFQLGRFGQVTVSSGGRLAQPTNVVAPGAEANALQAANDLNRVIVDDAENGQNPDPIVFGRDGAPLTAENTLRGGDTATGTVGVMTYTWGGNSASPNNYRVRPLNALGGHVEFEAVNERPEEPDEVGGDVQVASFNVLNYFNSWGADCPLDSDGDPDCRGAENQTEFDRQAAKTVAALTGLDADVVGVIEIENDGYGQDSAIQDLVNRLNAATAPGTYAFVDVDHATGETRALGTDAIKVGMLYKPAVVKPVGTAVLNTDSFVDGASGEPRNRPALAQSFEEVDGAGTFTAVVNHLKSKGSDCNEDGDPDTGDGQGNCNQTRLESAQELAAWLAGDPTNVDDADVLVMGDLNSYAKEDPITALKEAGYKDLVRRFEGKDAYSYVFDGQWGYLDHALASPQLAQQVTGTTTWHINADEPSVLDYNTNFKSAAQIGYLYDDSPYRSSDHDPVLVGLDLAPSKAGADKTGR